MDQRRPTVSAIIPVYNGAEFIAAAIESILAQTWPVDEIVVIDDGSTDDSAAVAARYAAAGVRCIRQENRGLSAARNRGIAETTGELLAFLDCDDTWLPEKTALQREYLKSHPTVGLISAHAWWWEPQTNYRWVVRPGVAAGGSLQRALMVRNCIGNASGVMVRRAVFDRVGLFDPAQVWAEDWEMWMRIASQFGIEFVEHPLIVYRLHTASLSHQRRWDRMHGNFELSRAAIRKFRPALWRPVLLLRAWSRLHMYLAIVSAESRFPRHQYWRHAWRALVSYPFDDTRLKLGHFFRALVGESLYRAFQPIRAATRKSFASELSQESPVERSEVRRSFG